jgi:hypothetical protein
MVSNVANGDVIAIGDNCIIVFYLTAAGEMLALMPAENVKAYGTALAPVIGRLAGMYDDDGDDGPPQAADGPDSDAQATAPVTVATDA